jgi:hypothetical protein
MPTFNVRRVQLTLTKAIGGNSFDRRIERQVTKAIRLNAESNSVDLRVYLRERQRERDSG